MICFNFTVHFWHPGCHNFNWIFLQWTYIFASHILLYFFHCCLTLFIIPLKLYSDVLLWNVNRSVLLFMVYASTCTMSSGHETIEKISPFSNEVVGMFRRTLVLNEAEQSSLHHRCEIQDFHLKQNWYVKCVSGSNAPGEFSHSYDGAQRPQRSVPKNCSFLSSVDTFQSDFTIGIIIWYNLYNVNRTGTYDFENNVRIKLHP